MIQFSLSVSPGNLILSLICYSNERLSYRRRACPSVRLSVRPSVCLFVASWYNFEANEHRTIGFSSNLFCAIHLVALKPCSDIAYSRPVLSTMFRHYGPHVTCTQCLYTVPTPHPLAHLINNWRFVPIHLLRYYTVPQHSHQI